jgi:hypothetical protein
VADLSREESKRLRAELAEGLGFYPASLAPEDVARYREQIVERKAREEAVERDGREPGATSGTSGSWHRIGPRDVPFEATRCRHRAVAIPIVAIASLVPLGSGQ